MQRKTALPRRMLARRLLGQLIRLPNGSRPRGGEGQTPASLEQPQESPNFPKGPAGPRLGQNPPANPPPQRWAGLNPDRPLPGD
jgi:hypothetical protein